MGPAQRRETPVGQSSETIAEALAWVVREWGSDGPGAAPPMTPATLGEARSRCSDVPQVRAVADDPLADLAATVLSPQESLVEWLRESNALLARTVRRLTESLQQTREQLRVVDGENQHLRTALLVERERMRPPSA